MSKVIRYTKPIPGNVTPVRSGWYFCTVERDVMGNHDKGKRFCFWDGSMWWKAMGWKSANVPKGTDAFWADKEGRVFIADGALCEPVTVLSWSGLDKNKGPSVSHGVRFAPQLDYRLCTGKYTEVRDGKKFVVDPKQAPAKGPIASPE